MKRKKGYYFSIFTGLGVAFGMIFDQLMWGLIIGPLLGMLVESNDKK
ncbi:hypothetical protein [Bacillus changyiensis]|nr:hypothetical protein [Bacillus changyiensis]MDA1476950.1 hypothetical protein [Bacillus changyiensis]